MCQNHLHEPAEFAVQQYSFRVKSIEVEQSRRKRSRKSSFEDFYYLMPKKVIERLQIFFQLLPFFTLSLEGRGIWPCGLATISLVRRHPHANSLKAKITTPRSTNTMTVYTVPKIRSVLCHVIFN